MANMLDDRYEVEPEEPAETEAPETDAAAVEASEEAPAKIERTPITRRQKAKERDESILKELGGLKESLSKQGETYKEELARISRENAELRGHVQGLASRPAYQEQRREEPAADPSKLLDEANAFLDNKHFDKYQRKYAEYVIALQPKPQAQPQQPQVSPMLQIVASQYVDVMSNRAAFEIAQAHDRILAAQGIPESPDRWKKAFEEGRRYAGSQGKANTPQFSTKNREVLSGVPRAGAQANGAGGGEPGVTLSPLERQTARKFKMSESAYAQHLAQLHPERVQSD